MPFRSQTRSITYKALSVWFLIIPVAFLNGWLRETLLLRFFAPSMALSLSGILLTLFILALTWMAIPCFGPLNTRQYLYIGAGWLVLSILFESGLGLVAGKTLEEIGRAYDIRSGNLWCVVLAATAASPSIAARLRGRF